MKNVGTLFELGNMFLTQSPKFNIIHVDNNKFPNAEF